MATAVDRITRIVDLFSEGTEVLLGYDDTEPGIPKPVVVWVNKLNSFETAEARADGSVRRSERMHQLGRPDSPEKLGFDAELGNLPREKLAERYVESRQDEIYLDVINDIETDPEWRERRERIERLPALLADADVAQDDPRRAQLAADQGEWMQAISEGQETKHRHTFDEAMEMQQEDLLADLWERYRQRQTLDVFMAERRVTQLYFAMRECNATNRSNEIGQYDWDHTDCDHNRRLVNDRSEIRRLPDAVVEKVVQVLDDIYINPRTAGNSVAPRSSSGSSEPVSEPEEVSTLSTPDATPVAPPSS